MVTYGITQEVTREGGAVLIRLSAPDGAQIPAGGIDLPEPVPVEAGEMVFIEMSWMPAPLPWEPRWPVHVSQAATVTAVYAGPQPDPAAGWQFPGAGGCR